MLTLLVILAVIWLGLMGLLAAWTLFFQGYIYTEPTEGIVWRAPVAGTIVTLFIALWVFLDYRSQGQYRALHEFSSQGDAVVFPELRIVNQEGKEEVYKLARNERGQQVYKLEGRPDGRPLPGRPLKVIVKENDADVIFEPDRDAKGQFQAKLGQPLVYRDSKKRTMAEGELGRLSEFRTGNFVLVLLLNFLHLVVWVLALWLILQYRFWHAFGLAVVAWLGLTLFLLPPTLTKAEEVAQPRTVIKT